KATCACNTYWSYKGKVQGENTDVIGFQHALREVVADPRGIRALIVGAGGGARAVLYSLLEQGAAGVTVLGRASKRKTEIMHVAGRRVKRVAFINNEKLLRDEGFDLVINATPLGLRDADRMPFSLNRIGGVTAVYDMVYRKGGTAWVNYAKSLGIPAADGAEMLVQQAAAAFELWFETQAPIATMRRAFES
ncbi:MAG TPA: hypothetical protein VM100_13125, partial [Longimicrobiales bacterium]|nr:hypothetical protein [Longimicrobiales bacterium]